MVTIAGMSSFVSSAPRALALIIVFVISVVFSFWSMQNGLAIVQILSVIALGFISIFSVLWALFEFKSGSRTGLISSIVVLLIGYTVFSYPYWVFDTINRSEFFFNAGFYRESLKNRADSFRAFKWTSNVSFESQNFSELIYDQSDEILRPSSDRTSAWFDRVSKQSSLVLDSKCAKRLISLGGHFYLLYLTCS